MGSVTKMFTAVTVLRLAERGVIALNQKVAPLIDQYLAVPLPCDEQPSICDVTCGVVKQCLSDRGGSACRRGLGHISNKTAASCARCFRYLHCDAASPVKKVTLASMWEYDSLPGSERIVNVTFGQLVSMTSGVSDYYMDWSNWLYDEVEASTRDVEPLEYLMHQPHSIPFEPGAPGRGFYSTNGFSLAGLALAAVFNYSDWAQVNQRVLAWGDHLPADDGTLFPDRGTCLSFPMIAKQYASAPNAKPFVEISNHSCLSSWMGGNVAARPLDVARFTYAAFSPQRTLISADSFNNGVASLHCLSDGFFGGYIGYGMGIEAGCRNGKPQLMNVCGFPFYGHSGLDYGSGAPISGYVPDLKLGLSIALTAACDYGDGTCGKRCSISYRHQPKAQENVISEAISVIAAYAGKPTHGWCGATSYDLPPLKECVDAPSAGTLNGKPLTCPELLSDFQQHGKPSAADVCDSMLSRYTLAALQLEWAPQLHAKYTPPPGYKPWKVYAVELCKGTCMTHNAGPCWLRAEQEPWC